MEKIQLKTRDLNLPKLSNQGMESVIYVNKDKLYKIFNEKIDLKIRHDIAQFVDSNKNNLDGLILPEEELILNGCFIGHTMKKYDLTTIDNFFTSDIAYEERFKYALKFMDIFNRMNNLGIEHMDFHTDNVFIDKDGNPLIGDVTSIRTRGVRRRSKIEQLSLIISLLSGYDLMNNGNEFVIEEIISNLGSQKLLDYFYNPKGNLDSDMFDGFIYNNVEIEEINRKYGG